MSFFVALTTERHFGRAAAACFVTQSTLSLGIAELERLLGAPLVDRSRRGVHLTVLGADVAERARALLRSAEDLCDATQAGAEPLSGEVKLGIIPTVAPYLLPRALAAIATDWPLLRLGVREMLTGPACDALQRGTLDCALIALPAVCGDVEVFEIAVDRLLLAFGPEPGPELADGAAHIPTERLVLLEGGHCLTDHALAACDVADGASEAQFIAVTLQTLVQLVDAGLGITLLPEMSVAAGLLHGTRIRTRPLDGARAERRIVLVWRKRHVRERDFLLLGRTIQQSMAHPNVPSSEHARDGNDQRAISR